MRAEEEQATQRPKSNLVRSQKGKEYDDFIQSEKSMDVEDSQMSPKRRKTNSKDQSCGEKEWTGQGDGGSPVLPVLSPELRNKQLKSPSQASTSSWLGLVNTILD